MKWDSSRFRGDYENKKIRDDYPASKYDYFSRQLCYLDEITDLGDFMNKMGAIPRYLWGGEIFTATDYNGRPTLWVRGYFRK